MEFRYIINTLTTLSILLCFTIHSNADNFLPGQRVLLDAHNCYPYTGFWSDRIDRALSTGFPIAIEQDLDWQQDKETREYRSIVSHGKPYTHKEPTIEEYFFDKVRPHIEKEIAENNTTNWPIITLNIDFKNAGTPHVQHIYNLLDEHRHWLCTAKKSKNSEEVTPITPGPMLVLMGGGGARYSIFYEQLKVGDAILAFGAARTDRVPNIHTAAPEDIISKPADNFHRWWNNSWHPIEKGGALQAGDFTPETTERIKKFADHAHKLGYWIRFYALDGHPEGGKLGFSPTYNFRTLERVTKRWHACIDAGVDFIASDQYEDLQELLNKQ